MISTTYGQEPFENERDEQEYRLIVDYLKNATPAQQFCYVQRSNYDSNRHVLRFLADRPETDCAVILAIYWNIGSDYLTQFADESDFQDNDYQRENWRFSRLIEARYLNGFYPNATLYFNPYETDGAYPGEYDGITRKYITPPKMLQTVQGTEYVDIDGDDFADYDEGLPSELVEKVWALYD